MWSLTGKTALVTGASGGIGEAIAQQLSEAGATVILTGRNEEKLQALAKSLPNKSHVVAAPLQDAGTAEALATQAKEAAGGIDILVANAGITRDNLAMRMKEEEWYEVLNVNLSSHFFLVKALLRDMMKARQGRIVLITSVVGSMGNPGQANYCASKAGMQGMAKSLAQEVASRGITVNCIAPGFIKTAMTDELDEAQQKRITDNIPVQDFGRPEDVAGGVLYLASDAGRYITGQTLHINGGLYMA